MQPSHLHPGTATEVTAFSVITDYNTGIKYPLADFNITPDVAIVDPELVEGLPSETGCLHRNGCTDTHAIEAYVSTLNCPFTDPLALQAIEMVLDYLLKHLITLNMEAKRADTLCTVPGWYGILEMHYLESYILWLILRQVQHSQPDIFLTGCANAIYLPYVIKYNAKDKVAVSRYAEIVTQNGTSWNI